MTQISPSIEERVTPSEAVKEEFFSPSQTEQNLVTRVFNLFREVRQERDSNFEYLDGRNILDYIDDSVKRFTTNIDARDDIEDWQARIFDPFTRNKVLAILGKIVDAMPVAEFVARGAEDLLKAEILNTLYEYSEDVDETEKFFVYAVEEALVKGTMVGYEGYQQKTRKVRNINKFNDGDDLKMSEGTVTERTLISRIVPLEEFYPSSVGLADIKEMPYCFWRKVIPFNKFLMDFSNYEKAKVVKPFATFTGTEEGQKPFYLDYITETVQDGGVEILRFYNKDNDEYVIIANGIWLNPVGKNEEVSPLPFNHKDLPFWSIRYDLFGADFFYGKSLPDRLKSLQDVLNVLHNMLLDQSFLTIFPPILVAGVDDIEDDFLRPGRRITVDTQGLPIDQAYKQLDMGTPSSWHQFILEYTKRVLEESSVDAIQQGVAGVGDRTTATEIRSAAAGVISLLGLFARFIRFGITRRAKLKAANILQFYTDPSNPIIEQVGGVGATEEFKKVFNVFQIDSSPMTPGKRGVKIVEMYRDAKDLPTKKEIKIRTAIEEKTSGKKILRIGMTPDYIRNFAFDVRLVANPRSESSKEMDRALEIQFQQTFLALHPDLANRKELAVELAVMFGKDPTKVINEEAFEAPLPPPGQEGGAGALQGGNNAFNTTRAGTGVGQESIQMRDLQNQMRGNR